LSGRRAALRHMQCMGCMRAHGVAPRSTRGTRSGILCESTMPELAVSTLMQGKLMVILWLHTKIDPPDAEWDRTFSALCELRDAQHVTADLIRQLIITDGGAPNAVQRKQGAEFYFGRPSKMCVVTTVLSNPIKRGVATALSWLNPAIRFYEPAQTADAISYLELTPLTQTLEAEFHKLQKQLPPIRALAAARF
jgi:hypothetical protein